MNYENYSEQELLRIKKFLNECRNHDVEYTVEMIETELGNRRVDDDLRAGKFLREMKKHIGKVYRVRYKGFNDLHIAYYYIRDLIIPENCTTPYNVLILGEELVLFKDHIEYKELSKEKELRLDNIDIINSDHNEVKEVSVEEFEYIKDVYHL